MQSENLNPSTVHEYDISLHYLGQKNSLRHFAVRTEQVSISIFFSLFRRDSPYDAVVMHPSNAGKKLEDLPEGR